MTFGESRGLRLALAAGASSSNWGASSVTAMGATRASHPDIACAAARAAPLASARSGSAADTTGAATAPRSIDRTTSRSSAEPKTKMASGVQPPGSNIGTRVATSSAASPPWSRRSMRSTSAPCGLTTATTAASGSTMPTPTSSPERPAMPAASASTASHSDTARKFSKPPLASASSTLDPSPAASAVQVTPMEWSLLRCAPTITRLCSSALASAAVTVSMMSWSTVSPSPVAPSTSTRRTAADVIERPSTRSTGMPPIGLESGLTLPVSPASCHGTPAALRAHWA